MSQSIKNSYSYIAIGISSDVNITVVKHGIIAISMTAIMTYFCSYVYIQIVYEQLKVTLIERTWL